MRSVFGCAIAVNSETVKIKHVIKNLFMILGLNNYRFDCNEPVIFPGV